MTTLSLPQLSYLQTSLASTTPIRPDSRSLTQFRPISYASSILPGCLGSVHLTWGSNSIIVGVKGQVVSCKAPTVEYHVEVQGERDDDPLTTTLLSSMTEMMDALDKEELKIAHNRNWELFIDAIVLSKDSSSPLPAMSLAVRLALLDTRLPKTTPAASDEGFGAGEFDVDDDYGNAVPFKAAAHVPLLTLVNFVGPNILFDASQEEEAVLSGRYLVGVTESGKILSVQNLSSAEPREGIQGRKDDRGISQVQVSRGIQEALDVSLSIFKHVRSHIEEPIELFETL
ncbi:Exosome complex component rrp42 [Taphrina deformans PYCC 5710]|uniref:Ribosomal RNA-processing protein 42 n=1 Tax=Taphrina deformans (strain PYCC 5710 / ATCC 11124 / CBS 356.35 / IMI 108563 / JCM 9778 / NBRC 8474) TaxID=1097556 RepID=R4XAA1_TAPDE|nr:Exosome complex component rrp42 [Taphrina deformans PYCC 5710]|eukprot:CCG82682.1 Exosome complex component rrp42 [Taphrina deformans PYCC 5710]